jgi:ribosomal protein S18 acetylase RimI-like enzyme
MAADNTALPLHFVEDAALNASAPAEQLWLDGWLVRRGREKAKRARCIQALAVGTSSVGERIERARSLYQEAGLPMCARVTPFSQPAGLDAELAAKGWRRFDESQVMVCARIAPVPVPALPDGCSLRPAEFDEFARVLAGFQGADEIQQLAHADRLRRSPVRHEAFVVLDQGTAVVGCGQIAIEGALVGLYGVHTAHAWRGRGLATSLCAAVLQRASACGASAAYLQVEASNEAARRLYQRLSFVDGYGYHYRAPP